ncbi:MAG TPA: aminoglycoside phosphotransferase family protein [Acidimicrobiia bacterium]
MTLTPLTDAELREVFENNLPEAEFGIFERHRFDKVTSYPFQLLSLDLGSSRRLQVVVKDFGSSRLPREDLTVRADREAAVYRDLITGIEGIARLYGIVRHPVRLILEHVEATDLKHHGLEAWIETAAWLGTFQTGMAGRWDRVRHCHELIRHDGSFFLDRAQAARAAIIQFGEPAAHRLETLLDCYHQIVDVMVDQPRTLVHGSFRPQNILVSTAGNGTMRVCPVDWELAGVGSPLYDLAFLAEGFAGPKQDGLLAAYLGGRGNSESVPGPDMLHVIDCFRLHKIVKSLSDSVVLGFRPPIVAKLLEMGEALRERLD